MWQTLFDRFAYNSQLRRIREWNGHIEIDVQMHDVFAMSTNVLAEAQHHWSASGLLSEEASLNNGVEFSPRFSDCGCRVL